MSLHIALVEPQIPWNTGNAARTCLALGAQLHLVGPLGFSLEAKEVKRAGLDYWEHAQVCVHEDWTAFEIPLASLGEPWILSTHGDRDLGHCEFEESTLFIFGSETAGLPESVHRRFSNRRLRVPQDSTIVRSLNLSTTVGIAAFEYRRQHPRSLEVGAP